MPVTQSEVLFPRFEYVSPEGEVMQRSEPVRWLNDRELKALSDADIVGQPHTQEYLANGNTTVRSRSEIKKLDAPYGLGGEYRIIRTQYSFVRRYSSFMEQATELVLEQANDVPNDRGGVAALLIRPQLDPFRPHQHLVVTDRRGDWKTPRAEAGGWRSRDARQARKEGHRDRAKAELLFEALGQLVLR